MPYFPIMFTALWQGRDSNPLASYYLVLSAAHRLTLPYAPRGLCQVRATRGGVERRGLIPALRWSENLAERLAGTDARSLHSRLFTDAPDPDFARFHGGINFEFVVFWL